MLTNIRKYTCDRCNRDVAAPGESYPTGWRLLYLLQSVDGHPRADKGIDLCPSCIQALAKLQTDFMQPGCTIRVICGACGSIVQKS